MEETDIRTLPQTAIAEPIDFISVDVSFISLERILPDICRFYRILVGAVLLIKPQFEAGRSDVGKNGIVRSKMSMCECCVPFAWHWNSKDYISSICALHRFGVVLVISNIWCRYSVVMFLPFRMHQKQSQNRHGVKNKRRFCHESSGVPKLKKSLHFPVQEKFAMFCRLAISRPLQIRNYGHCFLTSLCAISAAFRGSTGSRICHCNWRRWNDSSLCKSLDSYRHQTVGHQYRQIGLLWQP